MLKNDILFLDIETAPTLGYFYGRYDINISPKQVINNGFIMCYQAAWGDGKVFVDSLRNVKHPAPKDDKRLVKDLSKLINNASMVVAHNGDRFDLGKIKARLAAHKLSPFPPPMTVDTLKACKRHFKFEANSLDSVCQELGLGRKFNSGGFCTMLDCLQGDQSAWDKLIEYGEQDVILLRDLYVRIMPWINTHPNLGFKSTGNVCPRCGSTDIKWRGTARSLTNEYARFQCKNCGGWGREVVNCNEVKINTRPI